MTNKEIAYAFDELANLMELHGEDEFRIRSYRNAYLALRKLDTPLSDMQDADIKNIKGVGNAISGKIRELLDAGKMANLEKYREKTPPGVQEMLEINGFGPKKVRQVWQEMGIETVGELWYACNENRLVEYKGFGLKTQEDLLQKLDYYQKSKGKLHLDVADEIASQICATLAQALPGAYMSPVAELRRRCPVVTQLEILVAYNGPIEHALQQVSADAMEQGHNLYRLPLQSGPVALVHQCMVEEYGSKLLRFTGSAAFIQSFLESHPGLEFRGLRMEQEVFEKVQSAYVIPELREDGLALQQAPYAPIQQENLLGVLHVHTTWSDGLHNLKQMCERAQALGYAYIGITDHSQSAFYANGLKPDRIYRQWEEIDALNEEMGPFRILKGIESDILNDGSLDYEDALLDGFDFIIASVHSNLRMNREKATERVVQAIRHPKTTLLGHPTGRLLLSREGYPLDWDAVFDACKTHQVGIELNAHPYRLDIDYNLIPQAVANGIRISINPDAHSLAGLEVVKYGLDIARKGGLSAAFCFNAYLPEAWPKNG